MSRNVFISVLGVNCYTKCNYYYENKNNIVENVHFIQEATLKLINVKWRPNDRIFILLTERAKKTNWEDNGQFTNPNCRTPYVEGLKSRLQSLNLEAQIETIEIPDGNDEHEIWKQFETIYDLLLPNDHLYFDVTHSFRTIPMLIMVLTNYAKFLKDIVIELISYGNFDGRDDENNAKIVNITSLSVLQDWTSAANDFINYGNVKKLTHLSSMQIRSIIAITKGADVDAKVLNILNKNLPKFIANIQTNRGIRIVSNREGKTIYDTLPQIKANLIKPLTPLLDKISDNLFPFKNADDISNGLKAANWCLKYDLIQQGITILKETLTTMVCHEMNLDYKSETFRNCVDYSFNIFAYQLQEEKWNEYAKTNSETIHAILNQSKLIKVLSKEFTNISSVRNDINHAGFKNNSIPNPEKFSELLNSSLCSVLSKI